MLNYVRARLLQGILLVFVVSLLVFSMLHFMPGDPIYHMVDPLVSQERIEELRINYGFDRPLYEQYMKWLKRIVLDLDFGTSYKNKLPVWDLIKVRIPVSLKLTGSIMVVQMLIAVPLGLICAYEKDTIFDRIITGSTIVMTAIPQFWLAIILILVFAVRLLWFPLAAQLRPSTISCQLPPVYLAV